MKWPFFLLFLLPLISFAQYGEGTVVAPITNGQQTTLIVDLNEDGFPDILTMSGVPYRLVIYYNDGTGKFFEASSIWERYFWWFSEDSMELVDMDNDGDEDLLLGFYDDNGIIWLERTEDLENWPEHTITLDTEVQSIEAFDADNDGDLDLAVASNNLALSLIIQEEGEFLEPTFIYESEIWGPTQIDAVDFDLDGDLDLILVDRLALLENDGSANFSEYVVYDICRDDMQLADMDGDGVLDILTQDPQSGTVRWYKNAYPEFGVEDPVIISSSCEGPLTSVAADFDNDGDLDVISGSGAGQLDCMYISENLGSGNFTFPVAFDIGQTIRHFEVADFNQDGNLDFIQINNVSSDIYFGNGDLSFEFSQYLVGHKYLNQRIGITDVNQDGYPDIFGNAVNHTYPNSDHYGAQFYIPNYQDGYFHELEPYAFMLPEGFDVPGIFPVNADFDGDGIDEIFAIHDVFVPVIFDLTSEGPIANNILSDPDIDLTNSFQTLTSDIDSDGDIDILTRGGVYGDFVFFNNGGFSFDYQSLELDLPNASKDILAIGKLNDDPFMDLIYVDGNKLYVLEGDDSFSYQEEPIEVLGGFDFAFVYTADLDEDGLDDIVASDGNSLLYVLNQGELSFSSPIALDLGGSDAQSATVADYNNDGWLDVLFPRFGNEDVVWCENLGGSFAPSQILANDHYEPTRVWVADYDQDGDNDVILQFFSYRLAVIYNPENPGCTDPEACNYNPSALIDNGTCEYDSCVDLNGDGELNTGDLLIMLEEFGCMQTCDADLNQDLIVNVMDLLILLSIL